VFACPYLNALERDSWEGIYFARKKKKKKSKVDTIRERNTILKRFYLNTR